MGRRYSDPIRVWSGPDQGGVIGPVPVRFRWRWRTYVVTEVLDRWIEAGQWWAAAGVALRSGDASTSTSTGSSTSTSVVAGQDRNIWRVEARAPGGSGVFDLCERVPAVGGGDQLWLLVAVVD